MRYNCNNRKPTLPDAHHGPDPGPYYLPLKAPPPGNFNNVCNFFTLTKYGVSFYVTSIFPTPRLLKNFKAHPPLPHPIIHPIAFSGPGGGVVGSARSLYAKPPTAPPIK